MILEICEKLATAACPEWVRFYARCINRHTRQPALSNGRAVKPSCTWCLVVGAKKRPYVCGLENVGNDKNED